MGCMSMHVRFWYAQLCRSLYASSMPLPFGVFVLRATAVSIQCGWCAARSGDYSVRVAGPFPCWCSSAGVRLLRCASQSRLPSQLCQHASGAESRRDSDTSGALCRYTFADLSDQFPGFRAHRLYTTLEVVSSPATGPLRRQVNFVRLMSTCKIYLYICGFREGGVPSHKQLFSV